MKSKTLFFEGINWYWVLILCIQYYIDGIMLMALVLAYLSIRLLMIKKLPVSKSINLKYILIMLCIGAIIGAFYINTYNMRDYIRDIYYCLQPIIYVYAGYLFCKQDSGKYDFYKTVTFAGVIMSIVYVLSIVLNPTIFMSSSVADFRILIGKEQFITMFSFLAMITRKGIYPQKIQRFFMLLTGFIFVIQFSRTLYGTLVIILFVFFLLKGKITIKMLCNFIGGALIAVVIWFSLPETLTSDFMEKVLVSVTEVSSSTSFETLQDIQSNWRGYEIYIVKNEMETANIFTKIFGFGFGKTVSLGGHTVNLGGEDFTKISTFHNGYIYVWLKMGVIGVVLYLGFYMSIIKHCRKSNLYEAHMIVAYAWGMIFLTYTKSGIFRGSSVLEFCIYMGFCFGLVKKERIPRNYSEQRLQNAKLMNDEYDDGKEMYEAE